MSSITMAADSTQCENKNYKSKVKRKHIKHSKKYSSSDSSSDNSDSSYLSSDKKKHSKYRKSKVKLHKKKNTQSNKKHTDSSDCDSDLDLSRNLLPISGYVDNTNDLIENMFKSISTKKLNAMLPEILKPITLKGLKLLCHEELKTMSSETILNVLNGNDAQSSSSSELEDENQICNNNLATDSSINNENSDVTLNKIKPDNEDNINQNLHNLESQSNEVSNVMKSNDATEVDLDQSLDYEEEDECRENNESSNDSDSYPESLPSLISEPECLKQIGNKFAEIIFDEKPIADASLKDIDKSSEAEVIHSLGISKCLEFNNIISESTSGLNEDNKDCRPSNKEEEILNLENIGEEAIVMQDELVDSSNKINEMSNLEIKNNNSPPTNVKLNLENVTAEKNILPEFLNPTDIGSPVMTLEDTSGQQENNSSNINVLTQYLEEISGASSPESPKTSVKLKVDLLCKNKSNDHQMNKTQLEILELEMRARAIKAMLKAQEELEKMKAIKDIDGRKDYSHKSKSSKTIQKYSKDDSHNSQKTQLEKPTSKNKK